MDNTRLIDAVKIILEELKMDVNDIHLKDTPERVAKSFRFLTSGYSQQLENFTTFDNIIDDDSMTAQYNQMIIIENIPYYSLCAHHLLPFFGTVSIGYIPQEGSESKIVGISKLVRLVDMYARRLQIQEQMTEQIADALQQLLKPKGCMCVVEGQHLCMQMRGVQKQGSVVTTSAIRGVFNELECRTEFSLLRLKRSEK